jgi:mono/diheme cytochrome c family protein
VKRLLPFILLAVTGQGALALDVSQGDADRGMKIYKDKACTECHGWSGDGLNGRHPRSPQGADLRVTALENDHLAEVIRCGRPFTPMPYHDNVAYKDDRCYGMVAADFDPGEMPPRGKTFREKDLIDLVAYLRRDVIGQGDQTYENCAAFFGSSADRFCAYLKP